MQRFLVIQTAFLGDVILATPVISELKRLYPDAAIDVLVRKGNESILANHTDIRQVFTLNKKQGKFSEIKRLVRLFRAEGYDEVINLHRFGSSGMITWLSGGKRKVGFDKNPFSFCYNIKIRHEIGNGKHEVERNLELIAHHGAEKLVKPRVYPSDADHEAVSHLVEQPFYTLAPASVWFTKQLPEAKWVQLAQQLAKKGIVYLVGGPGDNDLCERIRIASGLPEPANLAGKLTLLQSCALFSKAKRCYVNDSGPLHMASAVNTPTTAFFCATVPRFGFGPLSDDSEIRETLEVLSCRPCGLHGGKACPEGHFKCGNIVIYET
ncbi:MAG: heptosyltransferase [Candidatus Fluviicola riflensis]|nr:MAG: heptosyltransferase [Candidatus Fluviicola riflensis]OGS78864.1 MAG: heptosyltransferase [Candidatus Fluviicola riflensis]OGS85886.1 MAG: heptosyltransferase [Fluviicola sp. RIFCSPHIGHO2_12_FULL_43_24]OGS86295.1 MAG: heptosyltransferase [Fluviicola sp. RIFCSPHIGHO2_01_FULL_43_53]